ncbi:HNH endonuclease family protein [Formosa sp. 3Alg 14/1]|uniref:HNH endonuclease n=1 Tax=Formosa sp. 3Alg 14/1 TaxID=3382190 RepID=UPI0039BE3ED0
MTAFQNNDPSLESQWRALILFGKNSATYKFSFAKSLLELVDRETTSISLSELSGPFAENIAKHLLVSDKQGNSKSSQFLNYCRQYNANELEHDRLLYYTEKLGFVNVVDAFQNINGGQIPNVFYEKDYTDGNKRLIIKDELLQLKESFHFRNFDQEVEARWNLVETAWNLKINPNILEVKYDDISSLLYFEENRFMKRKDITSVRDALNGYQKGKCFYSFQDISVKSCDTTICQVDHFLPHVNKLSHSEHGTNINGVWNLVLADPSVNNDKRAKIPELRFLQRLYNRNEFYITSKHPLAETIINQTGHTRQKRKAFLQKQYDIAKTNSIVTWSPEIELIGNF